MTVNVPPTVIDTSVVIAALGHRSGNPARAMNGVLLAGAGFVSGPLLREYLESLASARARRHHGLSLKEIGDFVTRVLDRSREVSPREGPPCPDPRDQHLWDLLATVPSGILVTGEHALLASNHFPGRIFSPRDFVERFLAD